MPIHWYPSHMAAAEKALKEVLPRVDVLIEVLDARLPSSSSNPVLARLAARANDRPRLLVLNKADLADSAATRRWIAFLSRPPAVRAIEAKAIDRSSARAVLAAARELAPARGTPVKPLRLLVAGIPNSGKSTLINALAERRVAKVGDEPGITRSGQWVKLDPSVLLHDTPGLLWPKIEDEAAGFRLAASGAVRDTAMEEAEVAKFALAFLASHYPRRLQQRYGLAESDIRAHAETILEAIGRVRGCLVTGGRVDATKAAQIVLHELRGGEMGRITFEEP